MGLPKNTGKYINFKYLFSYEIYFPIITFLLMIPTNYVPVHFPVLYSPALPLRVSACVFVIESNKCYRSI